MKKEEINDFIEGRFIKITRHFQKAIDHFEVEDIRQFRYEVKKLKVFFHLLNMESEDGLSYRITRRMKTIYGYLGAIQTFQLQIEKINEYVKKSSINIPAHYVKMVERELESWKEISKNFLVADYDFLDDKNEILALLPDRLTEKDIRKFIHYTLYELQSISRNPDDSRLESIQKFIEDIYYNYSFIKPFVSEHQTILFDKNTLKECLKLFHDFRNDCLSIALLQTLMADESEENLLKQMENDWVLKKNELKNQLSGKLASMSIEANNINEYAYADSSSE